MSNNIIKLTILKIAAFLVCAGVFLQFSSGITKINSVHAEDFNPNNIISDGSFTNKNTMSEGDIQNFLESKGSLLKDYSQNGKRASKIIYEAAQGITSSNIWANFGHPDWNENVSINPQAILVTIQKEEGLIEGYYADPAHYNQTRVDWAMGYGYTEGTVYDQYKGFYNQINLAAWQFYWNYERSQGLGYSDYQVGQTMTFSDWNGEHTVHIDNRATAALYRYTPHVYNGNYNFWFYFNKWFVEKPYSNVWVTQNSNPELFAGESYQFEVTVRNSGTEEWYGEGNANPTRLGTTHNQDRISEFTRGDGWVTDNRIRMVESVVNPGETATFRFVYTVPEGKQSGYYRENFQVVIDGIGWLEDRGICWDIKVRPEAEKYHAQYLNQNSHPEIYPGESYDFQLSMKNTSMVTWRGEGNANSVRLGTSNSLDRTPKFTRGEGWVSANRVRMVESEVAPGGTAHFNFSYAVPENMPAGNYKEYFRPLAEGMTWMEDYGVYWGITVKNINEKYHNQWISQNNHPELYPGESYDFTLAIKNTGTIKWYKDGNYPVRLGTSNSLDRTPKFTRGNGWISSNRIQMVENEINPGETAHFNFTYTVPSDKSPGSYKEYFRVLCERRTWMEDYGIFWNIRVKDQFEKYQSEYISQNPYPPTLLPGESYNFQVTLKNNGILTWYGEGNSNPVRLGTDQEKDRTPFFLREDQVNHNPSGWIGTNRVKMQESQVDPGEEAHFSFWYTVPQNFAPGTYKEYFRILSEGIAWMNDSGISWDIKVGYPHSAWTSQSSFPALNPGEEKTVHIEYRNTGEVNWYKNQFNRVKLGTANPLDRNSFFRGTNWLSANRIALDQDIVGPGETGRFTFKIKAPTGTPPGTYREYFRPVADGLGWLEDNGVYLDIIVN